MMKLIDQTVLVGRITLDDLVIVHNMFIKSAHVDKSALLLSAIDVIILLAVLIVLLHSHYICL